MRHGKEYNTAFRLFVLLIGIRFFLTPSDSVASIGLGAPLLRIVAPPGETTPFTVDAMNTSDAPETASFVIDGFRLGPRGEYLWEENARKAQGVKFVPFERSASSFIRIPEPKMTLKAGETRTLVCEIRLPATARGEYFAMLVADSGPATPTERYGADYNLSLTLQVSVPIFIIAGRMTPSRDLNQPDILQRTEAAIDHVEIKDFHPVFPTAGQKQQSLRFAGTFTNLGNVHLLVDMYIVLRSRAERRTVETVYVYYGSRIVFPNSERQFSAETRFPLKVGIYEANLVLTWTDSRGTPRRQDRIASVEVKTPLTGLLTAQGLGILSVEPERMELVGASGKVARQDFIVRNQLDQTLRVSVRLDGSSEYHSWVSFSPQSFLLTPGGEKQVQTRVAIRKDAHTDIRSFQVLVEPENASGGKFPDGETLRVPALLRIVPGQTR